MKLNDFAKKLGQYFLKGFKNEKELKNLLKKYKSLGIHVLQNYIRKLKIQKQHICNQIHSNSGCSCFK